MQIPTLTTERLTLRAFRESDLDAYAAMQADPEVMRHLGVGPNAGMPRTREESWTSMAVMLGQWALKGYGTFALEETATGTFIGRAGILHLAGWPEPELAYALARHAWHKGFAEEAYARPVAYRTMRGAAHEQALADILAHVFNHQTHHRGQAHACLSILTGAEPPSLDLLAYQRGDRAPDLAALASGN